MALCALIPALALLAHAAEPSITADPESYRKAANDEVRAQRQKLNARPQIAGVQGGRADSDTQQVEPEDVPVPALVESLEGAEKLEARLRSGRTRLVKAGGALEPGETVELPADANIRLAFEDGTQALVAGGTKLKYQPVQDRGETRVPAIDVERGEVRLLVPTIEEEPEAAPSPVAEKKIPAVKFIVRSRAVVMGVRGTDFIVTADDEKSAVHTLSGVVDIGDNLNDVKAGKGMGVAASQYSEGFHHGEGVNKPLPFDAGEFLGDFNRRHPRMNSLWSQAKQEHQSGRVRERMRQIRQQRIEGVRRSRGLRSRKLPGERKSGGMKAPQPGAHPEVEARKVEGKQDASGRFDSDEKRRSKQIKRRKERMRRKKPGAR